MACFRFIHVNTMQKVITAAAAAATTTTTTTIWLR
jgi:hypothetical protein